MLILPQVERLGHCLDPAILPADVAKRAYEQAIQPVHVVRVLATDDPAGPVAEHQAPRVTLDLEAQDSAADKQPVRCFLHLKAHRRPRRANHQGKPFGEVAGLRTPQVPNFGRLCAQLKFHRPSVRHLDGGDQGVAVEMPRMQALSPHEARGSIQD